MILRCGAACAGRSLHFLLAIFLRDNGQARGETGESVDVITVAMGENYGVYFFRRDFGNFSLDILRGVRGRLRVYDDDASRADVVSGFSARPSLGPVNVALDIRHFQRRGLLLCHGGGTEYSERNDHSRG